MGLFAAKNWWSEGLADGEVIAAAFAREGELEAGVDVLVGEEQETQGKVVTLTELMSDNFFPSMPNNFNSKLSQSGWVPSM